jgi:hypothetical protein
MVILGIAVLDTQPGTKADPAAVARDADHLE